MVQFRISYTPSWKGAFHTRSNSYGLVAAVLSSILFGSGCARLHIDQARVVTSHYTVDATWPQKPSDFTWAQMPGIAIDAKDRVYIFTRSNPAIEVYKTDGPFLRSWDMEEQSGAHLIRAAA